MLALTYLYSSANSSPSFAPTGAHLSPDGLLSVLSSEFSTSSLSHSAARECRRRRSSIVSRSLSHDASLTSCSASNNTRAGAYWSADYVIVTLALHRVVVYVPWQQSRSISMSTLPLLCTRFTPQPQISERNERLNLKLLSHVQIIINWPPAHVYTTKTPADVSGTGPCKSELSQSHHV